MTWTRTAGVLPWQQGDYRLHASRTVWLATTGPDGHPHVAPVWLLWDGDRVTFTTSRRTRNRRNLSHHDRVVLHLGDEVVILDGVAVPVTDATTFEDLQRAYGEKYPQPVTGEPALLHPTADHVVHPVAPEWIIAWTYGSIRTRTDWAPTPPAT